jgi:hypothetical protein
MADEIYWNGNAAEEKRPGINGAWSRYSGGHPSESNPPIVCSFARASNGEMDWKPVGWVRPSLSRNLEKAWEHIP